MRFTRRLMWVAVAVVVLASTAGLWVMFSRDGENRADVAGNGMALRSLPLRAGLKPSDRMTMDIGQTNLARALAAYGELTGRTVQPSAGGAIVRLDERTGHRLSRWHLVKVTPAPESGITYHADGIYSASEVKEALERFFGSQQVAVIGEGQKYLRVVKLPRKAKPAENRSAGGAQREMSQN